MPLLLASLLGGFISICGSLVGRVLIALCLSFVVFSGINVGFDYLKSALLTNMQSMTGDAAKFLAFCWVDKAVSLIISTYTAALTIRMAGATNITKLVTK